MFGRVAQLNRVADYGSAGYRFESCRGHKKDDVLVTSSFFYLSLLDNKNRSPGMEYHFLRYARIKQTCKNISLVI